MTERINSSIYFDSQFALSEKKFVMCALFSVGNFFVYAFLCLVIMPLIVSAFAVPIQVFLELFYWLKSAEWPHYTWAWLLSGDEVTKLTSTNALSSNKVIGWLLNTWISIPFSAVGVLIFSKLN